MIWYTVHNDFSEAPLSLRCPTLVSSIWAISRLAARRFSQIDGTLLAAAFTHYAFFSLFPLILLSVSIAAIFIDRSRAATEIISYIEAFIPIGLERQSYIFDTVASVVGKRTEAGGIAFLILAWTAMGSFATLIRATNRAWGAEAHHWWRLPFKSLVFLVIIAIVAFASLALPALTGIAKEFFFPAINFSSWVYAVGSFLLRVLVVFFSLSLFYQLAPRRPTRFTEVWFPALLATALFQVTESLFVVYLRSFATLNAVYGAFGGIMALLLWIYLGGCIFIFGACIAAVRTEDVTASVDGTQRKQ